MMNNTASQPLSQDILPPAQPMVALLADMVLDYARRDGGQALYDWLAEMLVRRSGVAPETACQTARSITSYMEDSHALRDDLLLHLHKGKSRSSWMANQIEQIARDHHAAPAGVASLSELLAGKTPADDAQVILSDWNETSRIAIAKSIEQQHMLQTASGMLEDDVRQWVGSAAEVWLKDQPESARLAQRFIRGELDAAGAAGLQATLAIAMEIATRQGLLGPEMSGALHQGTLIPAWFAQNTFIGTENARVLYAAGSGRIDANEALTQMVNAATAAVTCTTREVCKRVGGELGEKLGSVVAKRLPFLTPFAAPVGRKVGEFLGEAVGRMAGGTVEKVICKGVEITKNVAKNVVSTARGVGQGVLRGVKSFASWLGF